jgi:hypothetical protein
MGKKGKKGKQSQSSGAAVSATEPTSESTTETAADTTADINAADTAADTTADITAADSGQSIISEAPPESNQVIEQTVTSSKGDSTESIKITETPLPTSSSSEGPPCVALSDDVDGTGVIEQSERGRESSRHGRSPGRDSVNSSSYDFADDAGDDDEWAWDDDALDARAELQAYLEEVRIIFSVTSS